MSQLIRSSSAASRVRALDLAAPTPYAAEPDPRDLELVAYAEKVAALEAALAEARADQAEHAEAMIRAVADAEARGRQAGLDAADDRADERMSRLEMSVTEARGKLDADLQGLERLAALLAETALERLIDDLDERRPLIAAIIRRQMAGLDASAVLRVEVSPKDFPDPEALERLAAEAGLAGLRIDAPQDLAAGGCRLKLRLGELDVGLDQQWGVLRGLLTDLTAPPPNAEAAP